MTVQNELISMSIEEEKIVDDVLFPLTLAPSSNVRSMSDALDYLDANMAEIKRSLLVHGAILFRGFPVRSPRDFNDFVLRFGWTDLPYIGGAAVRNQVHGVVFTSNEAPSDQLIPFHHEMAQVPKYPSHLFFYCDVAPKSGGRTPICLSNAVYERVKRDRPEFIRQLEDKLVVYTRILPEEDDPTSPIGRGWKSTFLTQDKSVAEQRCLAHGGHFEWMPDGCLKTVSTPLPAIKPDPRTGKLTWFNSIVAVYYGWRDSRNNPETAITYGDGTPIDKADIEHASRVLDELSVSFKWHQGDVILVDNLQALHARESFEPPRRILAALFE